jgi:hypothetical protein
MAKLTAAARKKIPTSKFAGPDRSFPIPDKVHAQKAVQLAPRSVKAGNITPAQAASIVAKAKRKLGKSGSDGTLHWSGH